MRKLAALALLLSACGGETPPEPLKIPPAEARPANIGSIKWAPESPRYQQMRTKAWREGSDFAKNVDFSRERPSRGGLFRGVIADAGEIDGFRTLKLSLRDAQGAPVQGARIGISGGMPQHGHGLPTQPRIVAGTVPGEYRIEGLQFSMPGWWELSLYISSQRRDDTLSFNFKAG